VIAGDYAAWDKKLNGETMRSSGRTINKWYDDSQENQKVRTLLVETFINTLVIGDLLYLVDSGMPSGVPITSVKNSTCNLIELLSAIYEILKSFHRLDLFKASNFEFALYGDDHIVAVHPDVQPYVNFRRVQRYFVERGMGYTDVFKNESSDFAFEKLEEVMFLKRRFCPDNDGFVRAPLEIDSVEDHINWVKKGWEPVDAMQAGWETFVIEAHQHGPSYFYSVVPKVKQAIYDYCDTFAIERPRLNDSYELQDIKFRSEYYK
jgi:hypothetical protein